MALLTCRRWRARLVDLAEETLDAPERARLERHLAGCPSCAGELGDLRAARTRLAAAAPGPDEEFFRRQREAILGRIAESRATMGAGIESFARSRRSARLAPRRPAVALPWSAVFTTATAMLIGAVGWWRFEATFRPSIQSAGTSAPVPNDVDTLDDETLAALAEVADVIAPPRFDAPGVAALTAEELRALDAWLADLAPGENDE